VSETERLPVLPLKETVVFPESVTPLAIGQARSVRLVDDVVAGDDRLLALVTVRDPDAEQPAWDDLYEIGTVAVIQKMIKVPDGTLRILVQGLRRVRIARRLEDDPYLIGELEEVPDVVRESRELEVLGHHMFMWSRGQRTYVLIAREPPAEVSRLAAYVRTTME
jgi:ATP-dependent Lon protease